jgi:phosphoglycolate phosphatase-like HAD superfamily hydrolase
VPELLDALEAIDEVTLGLLTGNMPDTGAIKLNACGIDLERFAVRVWGSDSPHDPPAREHLPAIGIERYLQLHGTPIQQDRVTIIGDTPHDIACARAHDCRVLAVATGSYTIDDLAHADRAVDDLSDTQEILRWLTSPATVR